MAPPVCAAEKSRRLIASSSSPDFSPLAATSVRERSSLTGPFGLRLTPRVLAPQLSSSRRAEAPVPGRFPALVLPANPVSSGDRTGAVHILDDANFAFNFSVHRDDLEAALISLPPALEVLEYRKNLPGTTVIGVAEVVSALSGSEDN